MKKIQKKLLFLELENVKSTYDRKIKLLDNIIMYYLDEDSLPNTETNDNTDVKKYEEEIFENEEVLGEDTTEEQTGEKQEEKEIEEKEKQKVESLPPDIKNIYRKIMMITHPDKIKNKSNKDEYLDYYRKAVEAKNTNNKTDIIYIAYKLNIEEVFSLDVAYFQHLKFKISQLNLETKGIERSPYWVWYYSDSDEIKNIMNSQIKKFNKR